MFLIKKNVLVQRHDEIFFLFYCFILQQSYFICIKNYYAKGRKEKMIFFPFTFVELLLLFFVII